MSGVSVSRAAFVDAKQRATAALQNEQVTRARVDALESSVSRLTDYAEQTEVLAQDLANWRVQPFLGRLRWLFLGR